MYFSCKNCLKNSRLQYRQLPRQRWPRFRSFKKPRFKLICQTEQHQPDILNILNYFSLFKRYKKEITTDSETINQRVKKLSADFKKD